MTTPNNPPAFPCETWTKVGNGNKHERHPGLSMRDWFAGKEQIPWNVIIDFLDICYPDKKGVHPVILIMETRARWKYISADAMLAERQKGLK